jgi:tubulin-specific chaperone A
MAPPSKLAIATSAVKRLVKEEASYHKELEQQRTRITKLENSSGDENKEYTLKQEVSWLFTLARTMLTIKNRSKRYQRLTQYWHQ